MSRLWFDVRVAAPTDTSVYAGITVAVLSVATLASYLPARAASRVDPMVVLRDS